MEDLKTPKGHFKINWPLNEDDNEAEPKAKNPKNSPKSSKLPVECPNCKNLFEDQDKLFDHVETCNAPPETEEGGKKIPVQGISFLSKGQLISKCPFVVFKSPKNPSKTYPGFLP